MTVFLDTAVFMYAGGGEHPLREPCQRLLDRVSRGQVEGVTSAEVVQEIFHRYLSIRRPQLAVAMARDVLDAFEPVLPITQSILRRVPALIERYPDLGARELVHIATCLEEGIATIVSPDTGFDGVDGVRRVDPRDSL